jgi:hypothetical protein
MKTPQPAGRDAGQRGGFAENVLLKALLLSAVLLLPVAFATAADAPISQDQAMALLRDGKRKDALHAFDSIIASNPPDPSPALFVAGVIDLEDGNWRAAKPYIQRLVNLRPSSFEAWEMLVQADQLAGDQQDRDAAIQSLKEVWRNQQGHARISFLRDRIAGARHRLLGQEMLEPGGDPILLYVFQPADEEGTAHHLIAVRSDSETNQLWWEDGAVPSGTAIYHLDTIEQLPGSPEAAHPYAFYLEPPDYDTVRAKVIEILAGKARPISGQADPFWAGSRPVIIPPPRIIVACRRPTGHRRQFVSGSGQTTVNLIRGTGDVAGSVRTEPNRHFRDLPRLTVSSHRCARYHRFSPLLPRWSGHPGGDVAGTNSVNPDTLLRVLHPSGPGQPDNGVLGRNIGG